MPYVWTIDSSGLKRFVDDRFLPPCNLCGNPVSICQKSTCAEDNKDKGNRYCSYCQNIIQACSCESKAA
jgi:hypothetical protein